MAGDVKLAAAQPAAHSQRQCLTGRKGQIDTMTGKNGGVFAERPVWQTTGSGENNQLVKAEEEMRDLQDQVATLDKIVKETTPTGNRPLPLGLTGKITVVNSDWNFVVLDIGSESGLVRDAQMLVHRADKLIGKVRISNVQKDMAIAEIMTDWEQSPIREGDYVLY